ncbi:MAG: FAD-dependent oxidoreductase, partial [Acidobacteria bacterium]|nr:FAD-dependent oxidoreductase [Acidobacteriota bacterium]
MRDVWDVCIVGAGIVGLTVARALMQRGVGRILILEKEA